MSKPFYKDPMTDTTPDQVESRRGPAKGRSESLREAIATFFVSSQDVPLSPVALVLVGVKTAARGFAFARRNKPHDERTAEVMRVKALVEAKMERRGYKDKTSKAYRAAFDELMTEALIENLQGWSYEELATARKEATERLQQDLSVQFREKAAKAAAAGKVEEAADYLYWANYLER